jgi:hypothetical protein
MGSTGSSTMSQESSSPNLNESVTSHPGVGSATSGTGIEDSDSDATMIRRSAAGTSGTTSGMVNAPADNAQADAPGEVIDTEKPRAGAIDQNFNSSGSTGVAGSGTTSGSTGLSSGATNACPPGMVPRQIDGMSGTPGTSDPAVTPETTGASGGSGISDDSTTGPGPTAGSVGGSFNYQTGTAVENTFDGRESSGIPITTSSATGTGGATGTFGATGTDGGATGTSGTVVETGPSGAANTEFDVDETSGGSSVECVPASSGTSGTSDTMGGDAGSKVGTAGTPLGVGR